MELTFAVLDPDTHQPQQLQGCCGVQWAFLVFLCSWGDTPPPQWLLAWLCSLSMPEMILRAVVFAWDCKDRLWGTV